MIFNNFDQSTVQVKLTPQETPLLEVKFSEGDFITVQCREKTLEMKEKRLKETMMTTMITLMIVQVSFSHVLAMVVLGRTRGIQILSTICYMVKASSVKRDTHCLTKLNSFIQ